MNYSGKAKSERLRNSAASLGTAVTAPSLHPCAQSASLHLPTSQAPLGQAVFPLPSEKQQSDLEEKMISNQCNPFEKKDEVSNSTGFIVKAKPSVVTLK